MFATTRSGFPSPLKSLTATETGPNPVALINLAEFLGDDEAALLYRKTIEIDPDSTDAHVNLGNIFKRAVAAGSIAALAPTAITHPVSTVGVPVTITRVRVLETLAGYRALNGPDLRALVNCLAHLR